VDVTVVNTCTVTGVADRQSRQALYRARRASPHGVVVVVGCWARLQGATWEGLEGVVVASGATPQRMAFEVLAAIGGGVEPDAALMDIRPTSIQGPLPSARVPLRIQDGCDQNCAYCAVRLARPKPVSMPSDVVLASLEDLGEKGTQEVVLTGINLGAWGREQAVTSGPSDLAGLLELIAERTDLPRIRISSIEPFDVSDRLLGVMAEHGDRVCAHLHMPLQSGSDQVLRLMRRPYRAEDYRLVVHRARELMPDVCLGADVIAGLPGAGDEAFESTARMIEELPLSYLHVFPFSARPGTDAADLAPHVDIHVAKDRAARLRTLSKKKRLAFYESQVGRVRDVAMEGRLCRETRLPVGMTDNFIPVRVRQAVAPTGRKCVEIVEVRDDLVFGVLRPDHRNVQLESR